MSDVELYDLEDAGFADSDFESGCAEGDDFWQPEDDLEAEEADQLALSALLGGAVGAGIGGAAGRGLYDLASWGLKKIGSRRLGGWGKWLERQQNLRSIVSDIGAGAGGLIGGAIAAPAPTPEDADPFEPEYSVDEIDQIEALGEEAVEAEGEDAVLAADEMVARSFGVMRASQQIRAAIAILRARLRQIVLLAKRDPRYRVVARVAPLALRRTAVTLMRQAMARRPVTPRTAVATFGRILAQLVRSARLRGVAVHRAQLRARRHRARLGAPAPVRVRRPVYARMPVARGRQARRFA